LRYDLHRTFSLNGEALKRQKPIPGIKKKRWWKLKWVKELFASVPPVLSAIVVLVKGIEDGGWEPLFIGLLLFGVVWGVVFAFIRVLSAADDDAKESPSSVHNELYAVVNTVHHMLATYCKTRNCGEDIRATFHRVVEPIDQPTMLEQIIPYAGGSGGDTGRKFGVNTGITGQAIRKRNPVVMSSDHTAEETLRAELVESWGYTEAQARKLSPGRFSGFASPVLDATGRHAIGVIYFDSNEPALFDRNDVQEVLIAGCQAITEFVTENY
jgi:hypothetical protein